MAWSEIPFGKHAGKSLPQVALSDPDYIYWALEENAFKSPCLAAELSEVARKGRRIAIPVNRPPTKRVRYYIDPNVRKLAVVDVIDVTEGPHVGSSGTRELEFFDLSLPRRLAAYDKTGGRLLVDAIKRHVFGKGFTRLTRARCEAFFDDPVNFD